MSKQENLSAVLETMIGAHGLDHVLDALALACNHKADAHAAGFDERTWRLNATIVQAARRELRYFEECRA